MERVLYYYGLKNINEISNEITENIDLYGFGKVNQVKKGDVIGSGYWCSTSYDINYWKFTYKETPHDDKYIWHITNIYNKFITN